VHRYLGLLGLLGEEGVHLRAEGVGRADVHRLRSVEEGVLAGFGEINELVHQHDLPGLELLLQGADRAGRYDAFHADLLQGVDVGAVVDHVRWYHVAASVPRKERHRDPFELPDLDLVRGRTVRGMRAYRFLELEHLGVVDPGPTDYAYPCLHGAPAG